MPPDPGIDPNLRICQWISQATALQHFASYDGPTQSQQHIKPLHWYVACRLVLEGGFQPDEVTPHPPFSVRRRGRKYHLTYDPEVAGGGEATVLGGLKTKNVDVVVTKRGLGPVLAISCKGMTGAFRNLTNRMEETIGECTNLHITYPALVFGYLFVLRANSLESSVVEGQLGPNDIALQDDGTPVESIYRFHTALRELSGRRGIRNEVSRYEAISLAMIDMSKQSIGTVHSDFPSSESTLRLEDFFEKLYERYDERYVFSAPDLKSKTQRQEWSPESSVFQTNVFETYPALDFVPRVIG